MWFLQHPMSKHTFALEGVHAFNANLQKPFDLLNSKKHMKTLLLQRQSAGKESVTAGRKKKSKVPTLKTIFYDATTI